MLRLGQRTWEMAVPMPSPASDSDSMPLAYALYLKWLHGWEKGRSAGWAFATYNACVDYKSHWHNKLLYLQKFCLHERRKRRKDQKREGIEFTKITRIIAFICLLGNYNEVVINYKQHRTKQKIIFRDQQYGKWLHAKKMKIIMRN